MWNRRMDKSRCDCNKCCSIISVKKSDCYQFVNLCFMKFHSFFFSFFLFTIVGMFCLQGHIHVFTPVVGMDRVCAIFWNTEVSASLFENLFVYLSLCLKFYCSLKNVCQSFVIIAPLQLTQFEHRKQFFDYIWDNYFYRI